MILLFLLFLIPFVNSQECPGGTVTFDKPQNGVIWYPNNFTDAPLFPDDYQCKYQINVPAGWSARVMLSVNVSSDIFISPVRITNQFQETEIISEADQIYFYFINPGGLLELNTQKAKVRFGFVVDWLQYPTSSSSLRQKLNQLDTVPLMESIPQSSIFTQTADTQVSLTVITYDYDFYYMYFRGLLVYDGPDINSPCLGTAFDVYKKQIQFVSSGKKMTFLSLLRDNVPNLPKLILQDYSNTKGIVHFQGVACNSATWCGVYSMDASKGPVAVQTIYSVNYYESDVLISVDGQGTLEVYHGGVTKDKSNSYAVYNAATSAPYLPQVFLGPLRTYLLTYGQAKINLTRDWDEFSITKAYGRKGFVASQMYNQMKTYQNGYGKILAPIGFSDAKFKVKIGSIDMAGNTYFEIEGTRKGETTFDQIFNSTNPPDPKNPFVLSGDTLTVWYNSQNTATNGIFYRFEVNPP
uniref:CUB_2 domain-containing protein n=1 Tax=Caenorhabditis tropicalis TaxID=1561998 RepID=A0A1I7TUI2_9PELO